MGGHKVGDWCVGRLVSGQLEQLPSDKQAMAALSGRLFQQPLFHPELDTVICSWKAVSGALYKS